MTLRPPGAAPSAGPAGEARALIAHRGGEPHAFAEFLGDWRAPVFGYLARCGVPHGQRDDLFQEIFLRIHRAAASYDESRPLKPWLFTIVANAVRSHFRHLQPGSVSLDAGEGLELADATPGPDRALAGREQAARLETALATLSLAQREVVLLTCVEGMEQADVARALGIPVNTVKTHLRRGRLALARELARDDRRRES